MKMVVWIRLPENGNQDHLKAIAVGETGLHLKSTK